MKKDSPVFDDGIVNDQPWCYLATWLIQMKLEGKVCVLPSLYERAFFAMQSGGLKKTIEAIVAGAVLAKKDQRDIVLEEMDDCLNGHLSALDDGT